MWPLLYIVVTLKWYAGKSPVNCALSSDMAITLNMTVFMSFSDSQHCHVHLLW